MKLIVTCNGRASDEITKAWGQYIEREKVAEKIAVKEDLNRRRHELEELKRMVNDDNA